LLKPEGFTQRIISLISKTAIPPWSEFLASLLGHVRHIEANRDLFFGPSANTESPPFNVQKRSQHFINEQNETLAFLCTAGAAQPRARVGLFPAFPARGDGSKQRHLAHPAEQVCTANTVKQSAMLSAAQLVLYLKVPSVLMRLDQIFSFIMNANHGTV
jgi:hypothetical protein